MGQGTHTALITKVLIGRVEYYTDLVATVSFKMKNSVCSLHFSMSEVNKMMEKTNCYDSVNELVGKPCEILIDDKNTCHFKGMWENA